jgi:hypothetical protein
MEERSWGRNNEGKNMKGKSSRGNRGRRHIEGEAHGGEVMEEKEKLWKRNHGGIILEIIWRQTHPAVTQKVCRDFPGGIQEVRRSHPGAAQTQPEGNQRHKGACQKTREVRQAKCPNTIQFYTKTT